jgi:hypothetical protein
MPWEAGVNGAGKSYVCGRYRIHPHVYDGRACLLLEGYGLDLMSTDVDFLKAVAQDHRERRLHRKRWRESPDDHEPPLWMSGGSF